MKKKYQIKENSHQQFGWIGKYEKKLIIVTLFFNYNFHNKKDWVGFNKHVYYQNPNTKEKDT